MKAIKIDRHVKSTNLFLQRRANRRNIIISFALELFMVLILSMFYWFYSHVLQFGIPIFRKQVYYQGMLWGVRTSSIMFGIYAVGGRKTKLVRYFLGIYICNFWCLVWTSSPVLRMSCTKDSFDQFRLLQDFNQCGVISTMTQAHKSFLKSECGTSMVNPFYPPNDYDYDNSQPPIPLIRVVPRPSSAEFKWLPSKDKGKVALMEVASHLGRLVQKRKPQGESLLAIDSSISTDSFTLTPGIRWATTHRSCSEGGAGTGNLSQVTVGVVASSPRQLLEPHASRCLEDPTCAAVEVDEVKHEVCLLNFPATAEKDDPASGKVYYQKQILHAGGQQPVFEEWSSALDRVRFPDDKVALEHLERIYKKSCKCDKEDSQNCRTYQDSEGVQRFWCYMTDDDATNCVPRPGQPLKIYKEASIGGRWWSEDLCSTTCARCSGLGMPPQSDAKAIIGPDQHKLEYGSRCAVWQEGTSDQWCFVGFDSSCPDRQQFQENPRDGWSTSLPLQFRSFLPCNSEKPAANQAVEACKLASMVLSGFILVQLFMYVCTSIVIYKFLFAQCGDDYGCQQVFKPCFSSDSDDYTVPGRGSHIRRHEKDSSAEDDATPRLPEPQLQEPQNPEDDEPHEGPVFHGADPSRPGKINSLSKLNKMQSENF